MAVVKIEDVSSKGGWSLEEGRTYTVEMQVHTDAATTGAKAVIDALNLWTGMAYRWPLTTTQTEADPRCYLGSVEADLDPQADDGKQWRATLSFRPWNPEGDQNGPVNPDGTRDPFGAPPTVRSRADEEEVAITHDRTGAVVLNSAGDPFDPVLTLPVPTLVFEVGRTERIFDPALITALQGRVNNAPWLGWPAGSVLCRAITTDRKYNPEVEGWTWETSYEFAFREPVKTGPKTILPGWAVQVLDCGYRQSVSGELRKILDLDGSPVSSPVPLKSDGTVAGPSDEPHYLTFEIYPQADFSVLDFPPDLFSAGTPEAP